MLPRSGSTGSSLLHLKRGYTLKSQLTRKEERRREREKEMALLIQIEEDKREEGIFAQIDRLETLEDIKLFLKVLCKHLDLTEEIFF